MYIKEIDKSQVGVPTNCQRCQADQVSYHVFSDVMDMKVCGICAHIARELETVTQLAPRFPTRLPTWRQARRRFVALRAA